VVKDKAGRRNRYRIQTHVRSTPSDSGEPAQTGISARRPRRGR
jgi:hypothetical protein